MIYITGDTHGNIDFDKLKYYFENVYHSKKDYLIILGDAGIVWSSDNEINKNYESLNITIIYIDGNHENFDLLKTYPIVDFNGAKTHKIADNIYHILRGEIMNLNGCLFLCIGGAKSVDRHLRIEHVSYWEDENIAEDDYNNALKNLKRYNNTVDFVLTHCAPTSVLRNMFYNFKPDNNTKILDQIKDQINFNYWYFGHYHVNLTFDKYRCFYEDIKELPIMNIDTKNIKYNLLTLESNEEFLRNRKTGRLTKLKENDLPEWYYKNYSYRYWFYNLKSIKDIAIKRSPFSNHINKDSILYFSYDRILSKDEDIYPINEADWEVKTWRVDLVDIISAIEKYNPLLNLDGIKEQVNLIYDYYNNGDCLFDEVTRPYPHIKTRVLKDRFSSESAACYVEENGSILSQFFSIELAKKYIEKLYIKHTYGDAKYIVIDNSLNKQITYKLVNEEIEIIIKEY